MGAFSEAILTMRTRSLARTATCCGDVLRLHAAARRRNVRMMAATLATSRMTAASCAG